MGDFINEEKGANASNSSVTVNGVENVEQGSSAELISGEIKSNKLNNATDDEKVDHKETDNEKADHKETDEDKEEEWMDILGSGQLKKKVCRLI